MDTFRLEAEEWGVRGKRKWRSGPISCKILPGEVVALVGRPGSGKSILLERIAGIHRPGIESYGTLRSVKASLVPQDARLSVLPTDRIWTILGLSSWRHHAEQLLGLKPDKSPRDLHAHALMGRLRVDLGRVAALPFRDLSITERRVVLLARALLNRPSLLLLDGWDETMDGHGRRAIVQLLQEEAKNGLSVVLTSRHRPLRDFAEARSIELSGGPVGADVPLPLLPKKTNSAIPHEHPLLEVSRLTVQRRRFKLLSGSLPAFLVDGATFFVRHGETLALLGPEGAGKTKLLEAIAGMTPPTSGTVRLSGHDVTHARGSRARRLRREVQLVFQDAAPALEGNKSVLHHLQEAMKLSKSPELPAGEWLETLGLPPRLLNAPADELSASESQRVNLIRSLILKPKLILYDSPEVSAADTDGGLLASLLASEKVKGRSFVVATSDPEVARSLADRVAVIHAGRIVELGGRQEVLESPAHPVTQALMSTLELAPADPTAPKAGCPHFSRCPRRLIPQCDQQEPMLAPVHGKLGSPTDRHGVRRAACFNPVVPS